MGSVTTLPRSRPLTRDDLEKMPDDGHRYELVDGTLIVTPAPSWRHQRVVTRLWSLLNAQCPPGLEVFVAPLDVVLATDTVLEPDVLVVRRADLGDRDLPAAPVLAVEVLSPSTRHIDLTLKRSRLEAAGCRSYWVVDPDAAVLTAWELGDDGYVEVAQVRGEEEYAAEAPYPVVVRPADLVRD
ncbi:MAG: Uma2 family endonuclease [Actinomycetota bacterium]|nr:Uma2 family endonuclease [Actinomycetota bacterium]